MSDVRFIRKNGRVIPIKSKGTGQPKMPQKNGYENRIVQRAEGARSATVGERAFLGTAFGVIGGVAGLAVGGRKAGNILGAIGAVSGAAFGATRRIKSEKQYLRSKIAENKRKTGHK